MQSHDPNKAWYQVKAVWLVLGIPLSCVGACLLTIYLALSNPDYLVNKTDPVETQATR